MVSLKWQHFTYESGMQNDSKKLHKIISCLPKPIVFTNGVFDIIHVGHIKYLYESRKFGASLIVGINSNQSGKLLNKGPERPINCDKERVHIVGSLKMVDLSIIFEEATPLNLIKFIKPDIYTKGSDYNLESIGFADYLRSKDIKIKFVPLVKGKSSSNILKKIRINK